MNSQPLISVTIPTKNSARTLERSLLSIRAQRLPLEIIVADDCSTDDTRAIATTFGARILTGPLPLLYARVQAVNAALSDAVVLLDSDQTLRPGVLARCLEMLDSFDALVLAEESSTPSNWISELFAADKRLLHYLSDYHLAPGSGSLLPRVFKSSLLKHGFERIPLEVQRIAVAQDHAIIWDAVSRVTMSVGIVPNAVFHEEVTTLGEIWQKYFRWGTGLPLLFQTAPEYRRLTSRAVRGRLHRGDAPMADYSRSIALLVLKAIPYSMGFLSGRFNALTGVGTSANRSSSATT